MIEILEKIYPHNQTFISNPRFDDSKLSVTVQCCVPLASSYTVNPIPYVTAENYVRIFSQASYVLAYRIIEKGLTTLKIDRSEFVRAMVNFELYYRNLAMTFHQRVKKDESFDMELVLKNFREIKRLQDFIIFTFSNNRTVIQGEMSFVYVGQ